MRSTRASRRSLAPLSVLVAALALVVGCQTFPLGMSEAEWNALSPNQKLQARQQQAAISERTQIRRDELQARERAREAEQHQARLQAEERAVDRGAATNSSIGWNRFESDQNTRTEVVECHSNQEQTQTCEVPGTIEAARVLEQRSRNSCRLGFSWGHAERYLWVSRGCRARFEVALRRSQRRGPRLRCSSNQDQRVSCRLPPGIQIEWADIAKRHSRSSCEKGRSWGYSATEIWVSRGCRADFQTYIR